MKKRLIIPLFFCCTSMLFAQERQAWSLRDCINYAIENNIEIKQREIKKETAKIDLHTSKMERLPDLNGSVGQDFNFGRSQMPDGTYQSINSSSTSFGVTSSTPIFTGFRISNNVKSKKFDLMSATSELEKAKENLEIQITSLFLEAILRKEILAVRKEQMELTKVQTEQTRLLVEAGKVPRSQELDILAKLANDEVNITMADNDYQLSILNLTQALNLDEYNNFDVVVPQSLISDSLQNFEIAMTSPADIYAIALNIKPHVKAAEYGVESSKSNLGVAKSAYLPTLNLSLGYNTSYNDKNDGSFGSQFKNLGREYIGLSLRIPIFNRFQTRNQVKIAKLNIENSKLVLENTKLALFKEIQQAYQGTTSSEAKYKATTKALSASEEAFKYATERYDLGIISVYEYQESQNKLFQSKSEQIQAKYDYLFRSKILDFYKGIPIEIN